MVSSMVRRQIQLELAPGAHLLNPSHGWPAARLASWLAACSCFFLPPPHSADLLLSFSLADHQHHLSLETNRIRCAARPFNPQRCRFAFTFSPSPIYFFFFSFFFAFYRIARATIFYRTRKGASTRPLPERTGSEREAGRPARGGGGQQSFAVQVRLWIWRSLAPWTPPLCSPKARLTVHLQREKLPSPLLLLSLSTSNFFFFFFFAFFSSLLIASSMRVLLYCCSLVK